MAELTDEELASRVKLGHTQWFALLVERYEDKLSRYAKKFYFSDSDTEDVVQEVFVKAFTNIQSFDSKKKFSPWIYRIAHNEYINRFKKKSVNIASFIDPDTILPYQAEESEPIPPENLKELLDKGLDKIDEKYREPLVLYYYQELDYKEIADVLHVPISTVGIRLKRGREALKKVINQNEYGR